MIAIMNADPQILVDLRRKLSSAALLATPVAMGRVSFGVPDLDAALGGGIGRGGVHEVYADGTADLAAATGFAAGLAMRCAQKRPILWVRQDFCDVETGGLHPPGLAELGLDPACILLVRVRDAVDALRAGAEAARCASLGAVLIAPWGEAKPFDLTASRRLSLAAEASGVTTLLLRVLTAQMPSAAQTRWRVEAQPSRALEADAPGDPAFKIRLLRHRGGLGEREWRVEWNRDRQSFQDGGALWPGRKAATPHRDGADRDAAPLSRLVVPFPGDGQAAAVGTGAGFRRTG